MQESARLAAMIEVLGEITTAWQAGKLLPADIALERFFKSRRYMGSKDRGTVAEEVYFALRYLACLQWWAARAGAKALLSARLLMLVQQRLRGANVEEIKRLCSGQKYAPETLKEAEIAMLEKVETGKLMHPEMDVATRANIPAWMEPQLREVLKDRFDTEMAAMMEQAPVDLRANTLKVTREQLVACLQSHGFIPEISALSPVGVRLHQRGALFALPEFKMGWFEMQDVGSQLIAQLVDAKPGERVIDFCAGSGGKTLAIAASMKNKGKILAWDISARRMIDLPKRLKRAGVDNVETHTITSETDAFIKRHKGAADKVLVDVPCSGTGTWRRNPDLKWRTKPEDFAELIPLQQRILVSASRLVKPGGRLIYATCSLLESENEQQIERFLHDCNDFGVVSVKKICSNLPQSESFLRLMPHQDGTDGFFAVVLERATKA